MAVHQVKSLNKVDTTYYIEGDIFLTEKSIGILHNAKIEPLVKKSDIRKIVREEVKKEVKKDEEKTSS